MKKVVTIGGGSGHFVLLSGLRDLQGINIEAVVSMVDSGGSTGRLRDELGVLPPGDILKCILALSPNREQARKILHKRFNTDNKLDGHSVGNLLLTILSQYSGSFPDGVKALGETLEIKGTVLPVTTDQATLVAELTDGTMVYGEAAIDVPRGDQREKIKKTFLVPHCGDKIRVHPPVIDAIKNAEYIIIGPGDLYTSILPNFLVDGVREAIKNTKAKLIYVVNIMTKFGETDNFSGEDFVLRLEEVIGKKVDFAVFNATRPKEEILDKYKEQKACLVEMSEGPKWDNRKILKKDMLNTKGDIARHDEEKLAKTISEILK